MATKASRQLQALRQIYPWISTPLIISAPMRIFAGPALVTAVYRTGGIGFLGPGAKPSDLDGLLAETKKLLNHHSSFSPLPLGLGFQTFNSDLSIASSAIKKYIPAAVWLFAPKNGQEELDTWSRRIRFVSPKTQIWIQVGSVTDAVNAAGSEEPPDVLVLQGIDAGGHGLAKGAGIVSLLPEVADALNESNIPLIAAGGIADGRGAAAVLSLGAVGAVMGTRFLASEEASVSKGYKNDVVRTSDGGQNTVRTTLYDELAGRTDWPAGYDGRNIVNASFVEREAGLDFKDNKRKYEEAAKLGDEGWGEMGRMTAYVGSAVGLVREVAGAEEIVKKTREEAVAALDVARSLL
jgi:nitronate monooxygenase